MTFSIVAGHFELVVNPSQRTGVIGYFLTPVQCPSDLLPEYCNICTLHLFTLCTAALVPLLSLLSLSITANIYSKYSIRFLLIYFSACHLFLSYILAKKCFYTDECTSPSAGMDIFVQYN